MGFGSTVRIRHAAAADVAALEPLWTEFCTAAGPAMTGCDGVRARVCERLEAEAARTTGRPTFRLAIAEREGEPVGFASYSVVDRGFLSDGCAVLVDVVHVAAGRRKSGIGSALLRDAVVFADEVGAGDIVVNVPSTSRDMNRFYARLGFGPLVVRRSAPIGALRRRLGLEGRADIRDTADLSQVQRTLRRRAILGRTGR